MLFKRQLYSAWPPNPLLHLSPAPSELLEAGPLVPTSLSTFLVGAHWVWPLGATDGRSDYTREKEKTREEYFCFMSDCGSLPPSCNSQETAACPHSCISLGSSHIVHSGLGKLVSANLTSFKPWHVKRLRCLLFAAWTLTELSA